MTGSSTVNCSFLRFKQLRNMNPKPPQPQKGSLVNLSDAVYATSTMDLRLRYFSQSARVPLHPIQYSLHLTVKTCHSGGEADCTASGHSKSRREHKDFGPDQSAILLERFQRQILTFWPVFFFKHNLYLILPILI